MPLSIKKNSHRRRLMKQLQPQVHLPKKNLYPTHFMFTSTYLTYSVIPHPDEQLFPLVNPTLYEPRNHKVLIIILNISAEARVKIHISYIIFVCLLSANKWSNFSTLNSARKIAAYIIL